MPTSLPLPYTYSAGTPAAVAQHQVDSPAIAITCATAVLDRHDDTDTKASQQVPVERAPSSPSCKSESAPPDKPSPPQGDDLTSGQHFSKAGAHSSAKPQGQRSQPPVKAAAAQSAGHSQRAQHSRALSEHERPEEITHAHLEGNSRGIGTAVDLQQPSVPVVSSSPSCAKHGSGIISQRAAAGSLTEQPVAVEPSADVPLTHSSSSGACQREGYDSGTQPESQVGSCVDMADRGNMQYPQGCYTGGSPGIAGDNSRQHLQSSSEGFLSRAGDASRQDSQDTTGAPENGSEAANSPSAVRSCEGRYAASPADDSPECSPADDDLVLVENRPMASARPKHSQSSGDGGVSLHANESGVSNSQDPASADKKGSHSSGQAEALADSEGKAARAAGVEAANKENHVSSASLAGSDSQAGAQALMEEEQAKVDAVAVAQVVVTCLSACMLFHVEASKYEGSSVMSIAQACGAKVLLAVD